uniref:SLED domain-containing protein n=1 Tax=Capra hircus TaxID=9925 RepID=A0A8C2S0Q0_CAPHI
MFNISGENRHPCLVSDFRGNTFRFSPLRIIFTVCLTSVAFIMLGYVPSMSTFWRVFIIIGFCVYINKHGNCGPHLDQKKIQQLPDHFGPGPVNVVLRQTVQACVDCAIQSKTVFEFLKPDDRGGEVITAAFDGEIHSIQLPPVNSASFVLRFLENLCHSLQCDNLLSSQPFSSYRGNTHSPEENDQNKPGKRKCKILY